MKLKVGDKVRIRKDLELLEEYGGITLLPQMGRCKGKCFIIDKIDDSDNTLTLAGNNCWWSFEMVEMVEKTECNKLIFRDNATILLKDGKRYVTKCQADDTYDREKGLLLCLAKANGYTYNDICEMLNNAGYQGYKPCKITLSEFWANKGKKEMAIRCKTDNEADELLKAFDRVGQVWSSGDKYTELNMGGKDVCYTNNNKSYDYIYHEEAVAIIGKIKIYEFNEVDLSK